MNGSRWPVNLQPLQGGYIAYTLVWFPDGCLATGSTKDDITLHTLRTATDTITVAAISS